MADKTSIVRLFFTKMKPEFLQLSEAEQKEFMAKDRANLDELGMKAISMISCTDTSEQWDYIGVEGWPSMEAIAEREAFERDVLQLSKYVEYQTQIGHEQSFENYGK